MWVRLPPALLSITRKVAHIGPLLLFLNDSMSLHKQIRKFFVEHNQSFTSNQKIVVGVSGGPDSLALLYALNEVCSPSQLIVAHLNHELRATADLEADFVQQTAVSLNVPSYIHRVNVKALAQTENYSLEEAGRNARYSFFAQLAQDVKTTIIAVAHHADDQAETILMHLLRGAGLGGLRGMLPVTPLPGSPHLTLIRPLLQVNRQEIEVYCQERQLHPIIDSSNMDTTFWRNRLRHELLPLLTQYNPQIKNRLRNMATIVAADYDLLTQMQQDAWNRLLIFQGNDWLRIDKHKWQQSPLSLRRYLLRQAIKTVKPSSQDVTFASIERARQTAEMGITGALVSLPSSLQLLVEYNTILVAKDWQKVPTDLPQLTTHHPQTLSIPDKVALTNQWWLVTEQINMTNLKQIQQNQDTWCAYLDAEKVGRLYLRPRQPGERMCPLGMGGRSTKLKSIMANRKIATLLRPYWPIVATRKHAVWLVGHHMDERARVTEDTNLIICLRLIKC